MLQPYRFRSPQRARKLREWRAGDILGESVTVRWRVVSEDDCLLLVSIRNDAVSRRYIRRRAMPATPGTHLAARRQHPAAAAAAAAGQSAIHPLLGASSGSSRARPNHDPQCRLYDKLGLALLADYDHVNRLTLMSARRETDDGLDRSLNYVAPVHSICSSLRNMMLRMRFHTDRLIKSESESSSRSLLLPNFLHPTQEVCMQEWVFKSYFLQFLCSNLRFSFPFPRLLIFVPVPINFSNHNSCSLPRKIPASRNS